MLGLLKRSKFYVQTAQAIIIQYTDLLAGKNLQQKIQNAYGPSGLGILFVNGIPTYAQKRNNTLPLFHKLANLPQQKLKKYQRPQIYHSQGWSCGVQKFQGKIDQSKGSYYVNCASDQSYPIKPEQQHLFSQQEKKIYTKNLWVSDIPQIQKNVKALSQLMMDVGSLLALQIDQYAHYKMKGYPKNHLHNIIKYGRSHIGRMLHYFPFQNKGSSMDDWCGWHNDHGSLTALTSALYTDKEGNQITFPVKTGGLFAKNRFAQMARIVIPKQMLAFQIGQSTQILSGGCLQATPHCVVRSDQLAGKGIGRNSFALFMQPDPLEVMKVPQGSSIQNVSQKSAYQIPAINLRWKNGIYFKQFHKQTIAHYS